MHTCSKNYVSFGLHMTQPGHSFFGYHLTHKGRFGLHLGFIMYAYSQNDFMAYNTSRLFEIFIPKKIIHPNK